MKLLLLDLIPNLIGGNAPAGHSLIGAIIKVIDTRGRGEISIKEEHHKDQCRAGGALTLLPEMRLARGRG